MKELMFLGIAILIISVFAMNSQGQMETRTADYAINITTITSGADTVTAGDYQLLVLIAEEPVGNTTGGGYDLKLGFLQTTERNYTFNISFPCFEYWTCTGWVENGSYESRLCTDQNSCGTTLLKPAEHNLINDPIYIFLILLGISFALLLLGSAIDNAALALGGGITFIITGGYLVIQQLPYLSSTFEQLFAVVFFIVGIYIMFKLVTE